MNQSTASPRGLSSKSDQLCRHVRGGQFEQPARCRVDMDELFRAGHAVFGVHWRNTVASRHAWLQHQPMLCPGRKNTDAAQRVEMDFYRMSAVAANDRVKVGETLAPAFGLPP